AREVFRLAFDRTGEGVAAKRAEANPAGQRLLALLERHPLVVDHDQDTAPFHHGAFAGAVERHDVDLLAVDVVPDVELRPVREREDAERLPLVLERVVEPPELGPLALRVPAVLCRAEGEDPLLGTRALLRAARTADREVEAVSVEGLPQGLRL